MILYKCPNCCGNNYYERKVYSRTASVNADGVGEFVKHSSIVKYCYACNLPMEVWFEKDGFIQLIWSDVRAQQIIEKEK